MDNEEILNEGIEVNHIFDIGLVYKHSFYEKKYRVIIFWRKEKVFEKE